MLKNSKNPKITQLFAVTSALMLLPSMEFAFAIENLENPPVPEIPAGSAPFLLIGLLGVIFWVRNFFAKH